jgi:hypothetical protein
MHFKLLLSEKLLVNKLQNSVTTLTQRIDLLLNYQAPLINSGHIELDSIRVNGFDGSQVAITLR